MKGLAEPDAACLASMPAHPLLRAWIDPHAPLPDLAALEHLRGNALVLDGIERPLFEAQTPALLADRLHYETRVATRRVLATRDRDAHDAFNALVWLRHPQLKWALNARQVADIACVGPRVRTRGQCALTHFDEAGAIVWLADDALLPAWDVHDWATLFVRQGAAWGRTIAVTVFGHALIEHVWRGHALPVAKCLVVRVPQAAIESHTGDAAIVMRWQEVEARVAVQIESAGLLVDPQELRPLPLAGIPGWHASPNRQRFVQEAPCFRPLRAGRCYPPPWSVRSA